MQTNNDIKRKLTAYRDDRKVDELLSTLPGISQVNKETKEAISKSLHFFIDKLIREIPSKTDSKDSIDNALLLSFDKLKKHAAIPKNKKLFLEAVAIILNENTHGETPGPVKKSKTKKRSIFDYDDNDAIPED